MDGDCWPVLRRLLVVAEMSLLEGCNEMELVAWHHQEALQKIQYSLIKLGLADL